MNNVGGSARAACRALSLCVLAAAFSVSHSASAYSSSDRSSSDRHASEQQRAVIASNVTVESGVLGFTDLSAFCPQYKYSVNIGRSRALI